MLLDLYETGFYTVRSFDSISEKKGDFFESQTKKSQV